MPTREEMHNLTQEIIGSYEARVAGIASLRQEVTAQLRQLDAAHQAMARQQRDDLTQAEAQRKSEVNAWMKDVAASHEAMARQQRADLASSVASQLKELDAAHQAMARQQRDDLTKGRADLASSVASQLKELDAAHQAMARQQRDDLTQAEAHRKSEVNAWMKQVATTHAGARDEWQKLTATMHAKRGVPVVEVKPPETVAPAVAEEVAPPPAVEEVAEVILEFTALRDRVFTYLAEHPDGIRMTELEQEFGLARIQMSRLIRSLMDENKVEKRDLLYFAI